VYTTNYPALLDRMLDWSRQVDEAMSARPANAEANSGTRSQLWLPNIDLFETDTAFVIEADLPGVHQENVDVNFDRGTLTIAGMRGATLPSTEQSGGQLRVFVSERLTGNFSRSIRLPAHVDAENIEATFSSGVLSLRVPKSKAALARKITVRSAEAAPALTK
jgi:HSP20 family protein